MFPWPDALPTQEHRAAYADAEPAPYWLANLPSREPYPPLTSTTKADLCIVGGGFTGLWAALHAKRDDPWRDVVVLEKDAIGYGAIESVDGAVGRAPAATGACLVAAGSWGTRTMGAGSAASITATRIGVTTGRSS